MSFRSIDPRRIPATYSFLILMISVYVGQLAIAGSIADGAAYGVANALPAIGYLLFNPWLHSFHLHVIENGMVLALLGWWTEREVGSTRFALAVVIAGYLSNLVPSVIGIGGLGVGASGITNMLWAFFAATQIWRYSASIGDTPPEYRKALSHVAWFFIGTVFVLKSIAEHLGYVTVSGNPATGAHMVGVVIGIVWFIGRLLENRTETPVDTAAT